MDIGRERAWLLPTALLCTYGFLKEIRPSEPFLTPYLRNDKNLTEEQVDNEVYPVWTYSYMIALVFVFLLTDVLRYKPVIVFEGLAYIGTYCLLVWAYGVTMMKLMQFVYALATSTEVAYFSYIFASVSADRYQQVSSYTRSSLLVGRFVAAVMGQLLISFNVTSYLGLNYISFAFVSLGFCVSLFLPAVHKSTYFHQETTNLNASHQQTTETPNQTPDSDVNKIDGNYTEIQDIRTNCCKDKTKSYLLSTKTFFLNLWKDFRSSFSNKQLVQWSLWWAFATCGNFQVGNYIQNLWDIIFNESGSDPSQVYNGAVEALSTLLGALSAFLIMFPKVSWDRYGEILLGLVSIADGILLVVMGTTTNIWLCYAFYIVFRASYQLVITIATFQIAKHLSVERYALVFGWNTFIALVLESILTLIVVDYRTLSLPADTQFLVYGGYFGVLGLAFCGAASYQAGRRGCKETFSCCHGDDSCIELSDIRKASEDGGEEEQRREIDEVTGGDTQQLVQ